MLSECFAWAGNGIYQVRPIGGNYNYLSVFEEPFSEDMLERYLSVLHSYTEQIDVVAEDFSLSFSSGVVVPVPTIFFEKVDADAFGLAAVCVEAPDAGQVACRGIHEHGQARQPGVRMG